MGTEIVAIIITALFANNVVLTQTLGICPFLGVSKKNNTAVGMGLAVTFVLFVSSLILFGAYKLLVMFSLEYLQLIVYILIIASVVQMIEAILKKFTPALYKSMGVFLPLITTNCAILGTLNMVAGMTLIQTIFNSTFIGLGFLLALVLMASVREKMSDKFIPKSFQGLPVVLLAAAIMGLAFAGLGGLNFFG